MSKCHDHNQTQNLLEDTRPAFGRLSVLPVDCTAGHLGWKLTTPSDISLHADQCNLENPVQRGARPCRRGPTNNSPRACKRLAHVSLSLLTRKLPGGDLDVLMRVSPNNQPVLPINNNVQEQSAFHNKQLVVDPPEYQLLTLEQRAYRCIALE